MIVIQLSTRGTVDSDIWSWRLVEKLLARSYHLFGRLWLNASKPETLLETTIKNFFGLVNGKYKKDIILFCHSNKATKRKEKKQINLFSNKPQMIREVKQL